MRTKREIELLKARQILRDQLDIVSSRPIVDLKLYKKLYVKYLLCYDLIIEERKRKLKIS